MYLPAFSPGVGEVDDEDQLDEDEGEAAEHPEVHPGVAEGSVRDKEGAHAAQDDDQILEAPEPILEAGPKNITDEVVIFQIVNYLFHLLDIPRIFGAPDSDHDEGHQQEEEGDDEAESVHGQVADGIFATNLDAARTCKWFQCVFFGIKRLTIDKIINVCILLRNTWQEVRHPGQRGLALLAEGHLGQPRLDPRREHEAGQDQGQQQDPGVHEFGKGRVLAGVADGAGGRDGGPEAAQPQAAQTKHASHPQIFSTIRDCFSFPDFSNFLCFKDLTLFA